MYSGAQKQVISRTLVPKITCFYKPLHINNRIIDIFIKTMYFTYIY